MANLQVRYTAYSLAEKKCGILQKEKTTFQKSEKWAIKSAKVEKKRGTGREREREGNVKCYDVIQKS